MSVPCVCGHNRKYHINWGNGWRTERCERCNKDYIKSGNLNDQYKVISNSWHNYKPDNLKYLEQLYERKNR